MLHNSIVIQTSAIALSEYWELYSIDNSYNTRFAQSDRGERYRDGLRDEQPTRRDLARETNDCPAIDHDVVHRGFNRVLRTVQKGD